ncbi:cobalt-precorrin-5B (C(1))-methyltransferase CbiD [uncultured Clostridium sp.]|uniref:cobalt-precorrin-5B (C(1))-methyltransferase CbiD n=1 Tax=uncultured Clostridium sp. TaxID=59620 RepID=UPI00260D5C3D|nr:cobalt-precorrin-5B (C(1))-methyltransferase CbiD [uncultured Clostridium sp.]
MLDLYIEADGKKLRCGYTTGSTAAGASKAATFMLFNPDIDLEFIEIDTPKGIRLNLKINSIERGHDYVSVSILKDGGDDIDATDGIAIFSTAKKEERGYFLTGGEGVGFVTRDGLSIGKGEYAINPVPRKMIQKEVLEVLPKDKGISIKISVPEGREIAKKTFNPRLGIEGGISILGTTGIVVPMSEDAIKESINIEIKQKAKKNKRIVLTFGNIGEKCAIDLGFKEEEIVIISNFVGFSLEKAKAMEVSEIILVGHIGKLSKVAYGCFNTHSRVADVRLEVIALELFLLGYDKNFVSKVMEEKTSEGAVKLLGEGFEELYFNIGEKIKKRMTIYIYDEVKCHAVMYSGYSAYNILYNSLDLVDN